jgi:hypothetical protein
MDMRIVLNVSGPYCTTLNRVVGRVTNALTAVSEKIMVKLIGFISIIREGIIEEDESLDVLTKNSLQ